jgi:hypothetical protein
MVGYHGVFLAGQISANEKADSPSCSPVGNGVKHSKLHVALQYTTAHQPKVKVKSVGMLATDNDRNEPVIAKTVSEPSKETDMGG